MIDKGDIVIVKRKRDKENDMKELTPQRIAPAESKSSKIRIRGQKRAGKSPGRGLLINVFSGVFFFWGNSFGRIARF